VGRVWKRINEAVTNDDNRNIVDYMGRGDLVVTNLANGNELGLTAAQHLDRVRRRPAQSGLSAGRAPRAIRPSVLGGMGIA
jgi:outer membrane phospholipase A